MVRAELYAPQKQATVMMPPQSPRMVLARVRCPESLPSRLHILARPEDALCAAAVAVNHFSLCISFTGIPSGFECPLADHSLGYRRQCHLALSSGHGVRGFLAVLYALANAP